jgi:hypothetical protein
MRIALKSSSVEAKTPNILDSDQVRFVSNGVTIDAATVTAVDGVKVLPMGTVLGKITLSGKYGPYDSAAVDGRAVPVCMLYPDQADVTDGDGAFGAIDHARVIKSRLPVAPDATVIEKLNHISFVD